LAAHKGLWLRLFSFIIVSGGCLIGRDAYANTSAGPWNIVSTLSGGGIQGYLEGTSTTSQFNLPYDVTVDASGNVYVADTYNNRVRKVTPNGSTSLIIGNGDSTLTRKERG
jgi:NHL repeat